MATMQEALLYGGTDPVAGLGPTGSVKGGAPTPSIGAPQGFTGFSVSPGMIGSTLGGLAGRGLAGALTGSMLGPIGTVAGLIGSMVGYGLGNQNTYSGFGTPSFTGQTDPADSSIGFGSGPDPSDGAIGGVFGNESSPSSSPSDSSGPGGGSAGQGGEFSKGGLVTKKKLAGKNPNGPDDGKAKLQVGEYVVRKSAVDKAGPDILKKINDGKFNRAKLTKALMG